jgi:hypothetical protein
LRQTSDSTYFSFCESDSIKKKYPGSTATWHFFVQTPIVLTGMFTLRMIKRLFEKGLST